MKIAPSYVAIIAVFVAALALLVLAATRDLNPRYPGKLSKDTVTYSACAALNIKSASLVPDLSLTTAPQNTQFQDEMPNIREIPIYSGASEEKLSRVDDGIASVRFAYTVLADETEVAQYYREVLKQNNWTPLHKDLLDHFDGRLVYNASYSWTHPDNSLPWHLNLDVDVRGYGGERKTWVTLNYGVYPDVGVNLPVYPQATNVELACEENFVIIVSDLRDDYHGIVTKTYETTAAPSMVADFYNSTLRPYAWDYYDETQRARGLTGRMDEPVGDITTDKGLLFIGISSYPVLGVALGPELAITAKPIEGGKTRVQLRVDLSRNIIYMTDEPHPATRRR